MALTRKQFKNIFGEGFTQGAVDAYNKQLQDKADAENDKELAKKKADEEFNWDDVKDLGVGLVAGGQQAIGGLADVALQASTAVGEAKRAVDPFKSSKQKDKERDLDVAATEELRKKIHKSKDITGREIGGTSSVDKAASNISAGKGSFEDFKDVGVMGLKIGADATSLVNPVAMATRSTAGRVAKDVFNNALVGSIGGGSTAAVEDQDVLTGMGMGAIGGGGLAGAGHIVGGLVRKARGKGSKTAEVTDSTTTTPAPQKQLKATSESLEDLQSQLDDIYAGKLSDDMYDTVTADGKPVTTDDIARATQKQAQILEEQKSQLMKQAESATDVERDNAINAINQIDDKLAALKEGQSDAIMETLGEGTTRTVNADKVRATVKDLTARRDLAATQAVADSEFAGNKVKTTQEIDTELDNINKGIVSDDLKVNHPEVTNVSEAAFSSSLPDTVRASARQVMDEKEKIDNALSELMDEKTYNSQHDKMDQAYNDRMAQIEVMPAPRQEIELQKLNEQYTKDLDELEQRFEADSEQVSQLTAIQEHLSMKEMEIVNDINRELELNPDIYKITDETAVASRVEQLQKERNKSLLLDQNGNSIINLSDETIDDNLTSPELGNTTSKLLEETFTNDGKRMFSNVTRRLNALYTGKAFSSASHNLEEIFGEDGLRLFGRIVKGYAHTSKANKDTANVLKNVQKVLGGSKELNSKIVDILEGKDIDISSLNPQQIDAVNSLRKMFSDAKPIVRKIAHDDVVYDFKMRLENGNIKFTADEIKALAKRDGIKPKEAISKYGDITEFKKSDVEYLASQRAANSTIDNYFPHLFDQNGRELELIDSKFAKPSSKIKFGNVLHRFSDGENYSRDIIDVSIKYFSTLNKKAYLEPVLRELDDAKWAVKAAEGDTVGIEEWIEDYQSQLKFNKQSGTGKAYNELIDSKLAKKDPNDKRIGKNHYRTLLSTQRQVNALAALGGSFRNALQQITQIAITIGNIGTKNTLIGMNKYLKQSIPSKTHNEYMNILTERGITHAGIAQEAYGDLVNDSLGGTIREAGDKLSDALLIMTSKMDEFSRGTAYEGALHANLKKGMSFEKADELATAQAAKYNFMTSKVDMPLKLNGDGIRSLTQFMTFSYKTAEAWKDLGIKSFKDPETGKFKMQPKEAKKLAQMLVFYGIAFEGMAQFAGISPEDNIPFWGNIVGDSGLPKSPIVSILVGREGSPGLIDIVNGIKAPQGASEFDKNEYRMKMLGSLSDLAVKSFVPAGSQGKKSLDAINTNKSGYAKSKSGDIQFIQDTDPFSQVGSTLFGKYSTKAGQDWIRKGFPTLTEAQSDKVRMQDSEEAKRQYAEFYQSLKSVSGRNDAKSLAEEQYKTSPAKAKRTIRDYNSLVEDALDEYRKNYSTMPSELKDYLDSKVKISWENIGN